MKIMHLITGLRRAGAEGMLLKLLQQIDKARFTSSVVALSADDEIADEIRNLGVPVHVLGIGRRCGAVAGGYRLFRLVRREKPEVLQTWLYQADFAGLAISWLVPKVKLIWNVRSTRIDSAHFPLRNRILPKLLAATSRRPAAVIVNSEAGKRDHMEMGYRPKRWAVLPNGFDLARYRPNPEKRLMWRTKLGIGGEPLIGMVARVNPMKNHSGFLRAATMAAAARPDARFVLAGRGTDSLVIPPSLAGRVETLGERDDIADILPALDLLVLPSLCAEGFPNVLGEAIDELGPVDSDQRLPIHRPAPSFEDQEVATEVFETGFKVVDLLAPYPRGGKEIGRAHV